MTHRRIRVLGPGPTGGVRVTGTSSWRDSRADDSTGTALRLSHGSASRSAASESPRYQLEYEKPFSSSA
eukprot:2336450-Rhodomonas_salina.1